MTVFLTGYSMLPLCYHVCVCVMDKEYYNDCISCLHNFQQAVVRKHNKPCPRVAHRSIVWFLGIDKKCIQVVSWSLHTFPENFMQIGPVVCL